MGYGQMGKGLADKAIRPRPPNANHLPALKDRIVIVGVTVAGTDPGATPLDHLARLVVAHLNVVE